MYHWFLIFLDKSIYRRYKIKYDYVTHNYFLYENSRFLVKSCFIIIRTSEKCFRVSYYNLDNVFIYKTFRSARDCAKFIKELSDKY